MNRWVKFIIGLSLISALALSAAWHHYVYAPMQTQVEFEALMDDAAGLLKRRKTGNRAKVATSISSLLDTPQLGETAEKKAERLAAKKQIDAAIKDAAPEISNTDFQAYKDSLKSLEPRFAVLNHRHLEPCQSDDAYRNWGALRLWESWAKNRVDFSTRPEGTIAAYEAAISEYTGRPVSFDDIKAAGDAEYAAVTAQLEQLAEQVNTDFGLDLDSFAVRPENFSTSDEDIIARTGALLRNIEAQFSELGDFDFAPVPAGRVQTQRGYGPRYAIASYIRNDDAMRLYWTYGRYNHIYDTMLAVHEIMPGHHLQIKMETRRACGVGPISAPTPVLEGWATYAEFLADERGMFDAPDQRLGWLDYRLVRAMRIIMDTARLDNNLSEEKAWALWQKKMPKRLNDDFPREWARINSSPHHLSYIFGSQAILDARESLKQKMGAEFDEAEFHAAFLNAYHQSLMFLPERIEAQMRARTRLDYVEAGPIETAL